METVGFVPGDGWMIEYTFPDGEKAITPVVAWCLSSDGGYVTGFPVDTDSNGELGQALVAEGGKVRIFHPKQE